MNPNFLIHTATGLVRGVAGQAQKTGAGLLRQVFGGGDDAAPAPKDLDDTTITRKVESALYRVPGVDKGAISVQTVEGTVELRGTVKQAVTIRALEAAAAGVPEVKGVTNLLHQKKTPARARKTTPTTKQREQAKRAKVRITDDHADVIAGNAEPRPDELAKARKGRQAAPLGAKDTTDASRSEDAAAKGQAPVADQTETPVATLGGRTPA